MGKLHGLYGHIQRNFSISRWMIMGFCVATCVCWILCCISYNIGVRQFFGEEMHHDMFRGGGVFAHSGGRKVDVGPNASPQCRQDIRRCKTLVIPSPPSTTDHVMTGAETGLRTLHIPILGLLAWLGVFLYQHGAIVSWATGAIPTTRVMEKRLFNIVENLSIGVGQPMPKLQIIESDAMNAFASGLSPDDSMIAVTRGLLSELSDRELEAVLAHEYTHILNGDSRVMLVAAVFISAFENLFHFFMSGITGAHEKNALRRGLSMPTRVIYGAILFAPLCLSLALCWVPSLIGRARLSRSRELLADAGAVELTKESDALVSALLKIERCETELAIPSTMKAMMIFGRSEGIFSTHPTVESRIAALRAYAGARMPVTRVRLASAVPKNPGQQPQAFGRRAGSRSTGPTRSPRVPAV